MWKYMVLIPVLNRDHKEIALITLPIPEYMYREEWDGMEILTIMN